MFVAIVGVCIVRKEENLKKIALRQQVCFCYTSKKKVDPKGESEVCGDNSASSVLVLQLLTQTIGGAHHPEKEEEGGRESKHQQQCGVSPSCPNSSSRK